MIKDKITELKDNANNQINSIKNAHGQILPLAIYFYVSMFAHMYFMNWISFIIFIPSALIALGFAQVLTNQDKYAQQIAVIQSALSKKSVKKWAKTIYLNLLDVKKSSLSRIWKVSLNWMKDH